MKNIIFYEKIAVGGMSTIYKGRYNETDVVIKKLHSHLSEDKEFIKRFKREAEIIKRLKHPNIIRFISFERIENDYFLILEYIDGENLGDIIKKRKIPLRICLNFGLQIAQGINYAHRNGIIHRDIKPSNIIISKKGIAKILDFGLAYEEGIRFTDPGVYMGTPAYIAPEVLSGKKYSIASDVFSFGILLYEMISGSNPFDAKTPFETINKILYTNPERLFIDDELYHFVFRLISKRPEERVKDFNKIIDKLKEFIISDRKEVILWLNEKFELKDDKIIKKERNYSFIFILLLLFIFITSSFLINKLIKNRVLVMDIEEKIDTTTKKMVNLKSLSVYEKKEEEKKIPIERKIPEDSGFVIFEIKGDGEIFINEEFFKTAPIQETMKIKIGDYSVKMVSIEGFSIEKKISLKANDTIKIEEVLEYSFLKLKVKPWGYVFLNGENKGMTPLTPLRLEPGIHKLTITNPKFNEWSKEISIKGGETLFINIELK